MIYTCLKSFGICELHVLVGIKISFEFMRYECKDIV